jgi:tRNA dimethylallyltransferase
VQLDIPVIFVIGPTASGKTAVSYELAKLFGGQIINIDVGQFYKPLSIGTAKPAWRHHTIRAHLFDVCQTPEDFSVIQYRTMVFKKINELHSKGIIPIVVGGSLFYVQSLFFPPKELQHLILSSQPPKQSEILDSIELTNSIYLNQQQSLSSKDLLNQASNLWQVLTQVDPIRAKQIHQNDTYRIQRALDIWTTTGQLPSQFQPTFDFNYPAYIFMLTPDKAVLRKRIAERTMQMLEIDGWIDEAASLIDTEWEFFVRTKGLLGYDLIFDAIRNQNATPLLLAPKIIEQTGQYAKRQLTFLRGFTKKILALTEQKKTIVLHSCSDQVDISYTQVARLVGCLQK